MTSKNQLVLAWSVAGVLAVALAIAVFMLLNPRPDLDTVLGNGAAAVKAQRDQIAADCAGTSQDSRAACQKDLDDLATILKDFSSDLKRATSTAAVPGQ